MNVMTHSGQVDVVVIGLGPGERLLEAVREAVREHDIRSGAVVSGIGTLKTCHLHYITHTDFPPADKFFKLGKPLELLSVSGAIAEGEPHLHVVVSCGENEVYAGHLEPESEVCYLAELVILKFNALGLTRRPDPRGIRLLGPKE